MTSPVTDRPAEAGTGETSTQRTDLPGRAGDLARRPSADPISRPQTGMSLITDHGKTHIADGVVAKIAGLAAKDVPGVYSMGAGMARRVGQLRSMIPGTSNDPAASASQGVSVEVGEREAAIDLDVVTWYGQSIVEVTDAVREHVTEQIEGMTGLKVVEVNINVDDIHVETDDTGEQEARVQ
ncbi:Asp23/Gls24 family envelope stress response protein [Catellatospora sichuanensis]|uniref:Asp23/Gls24 family envelope stress response protein n=1 Tax=Catellatospora sichuanensis TaxID=1969805 RepID=UPI00118453C8|nr:Asp23/Gls24 family envelope stress response protein [Catellatospora sichuanensis]